ncbi:MAG: neutral zinc metallopeptidase [Caulobacteraceae bacterium]|nr:neutral zinc metallopeptidase [Caulobacter sp.]
MRWEDERQSTNVDDLRGQDTGGGYGFGGGGGGGGLGMLFALLPLVARGGGGGLVVLLIIGALVFLPRLMGGGGEAPSQPAGYSQAQPGGAPAANDPDIRFVRAVTAYTEDTWSRIFQAQGRTYEPPRVTVYTRAVRTGCGAGQAAMGPFYCPSDHHVYLDLSFFKELSGRFGAPGRFAQAYVIAHEVGHHVQTLLGTTAKVDEQRGAMGERNDNPLSVRTELQADCYAGVWANQTNRTTHFLEPGDVDQALAAAAAVGDDTLQKETQGRVVPDSFTHGTSAERTRWFKRGFESGDMGQCDTFSPAYDAL